VVTTSAGSLPEVCGDAAMLVPPGDRSALAAAIVEVTTDQARADHLVRAGCQRLEAFSWDRTTSQMRQLYRALADQR
jgi:glycosyltransferase involved in cell wall biosynthesis